MYTEKYSDISSLESSSTSDSSNEETFDTKSEIDEELQEESEFEEDEEKEDVEEEDVEEEDEEDEGEEVDELLQFHIALNKLQICEKKLKNRIIEAGLIIFNSKKLDTGFVLYDHNKLIRLKHITGCFLGRPYDVKVGEWIDFFPMKIYEYQDKLNKETGETYRSTELAIKAIGAVSNFDKHIWETKVDQETGFCLVKVRLAVPRACIPPKKSYEYDAVEGNYHLITLPISCWCPELGDIEDKNGIVAAEGIQQAFDDSFYEAWIALSMEKSPISNQFLFRKNIHSIISGYSKFSAGFLSLITQKWTENEKLKYEREPSTGREAEADMHAAAEPIAKYNGLIIKTKWTTKNAPPIMKIVVWNPRFGNLLIKNVEYQKYKPGQLVTFFIMKIVTKEKKGHFIAIKVKKMTDEEAKNQQIKVLCCKKDAMLNPNIEIDVVFPFKEQDVYKFYHPFCGMIKIEKNDLQNKIEKALIGVVNHNSLEKCHIKRVLGRKVRLEFFLIRTHKHPEQQSFWHQTHFCLKKVKFYEDTYKLGFNFMTEPLYTRCPSSVLALSSQLAFQFA